MRSGNPTLNESTFTEFFDQSEGRSDRMTIGGTVNRTIILLSLCCASACMTWPMVMRGAIGEAIPWAIGGAVASLIISMVICWKPTCAPYGAPMYAIAEGLFLGAFSGLCELRYPGIPIQAASMTFGTMFALLLAYRSGLIKATENFKLGVVAATGGIALVYLVAMVLRLFHVPVPFLNDPSPIGIGISLFVVVVAALNLVLDFDFIEEASKNRVPKYMEWYGAFGLMVTLVWLYIEFMRLLIKIAAYTQGDD